MKLVVATFMLVCLVLGSSVFETTMADPPSCDSKCGVRCSKAGDMDRCLKDECLWIKLRNMLQELQLHFGRCSEKCNCVPSGTDGKKDECPCDRDDKNSEGNPQCP
ncbi:hypothetical protein ABKV19_025457 [Rosa sericea]